MHQTMAAAAPTAFLSVPAGAVRFLIADPDAKFRDSLALIMGAMEGGSVVCRASSATEVGEWLAVNPFGWDVALVDAGIACDPASGLRHCGQHLLTGQSVVVLSDGVRRPPGSEGQAAVLACYDKQRDMARVVGLCMHLRNRLIQSAPL